MCGDAVGRHARHALAPAHGAGHLLDEALLDLGGIGDRRRQHVGDQRHRGRLDLDLGQRLGHGVGGRLHQRAMEGRADVERQEAAHAVRLGERRRRGRSRSWRRRSRPGSARCRWRAGTPRPARLRRRASRPRPCRRRAAPPWRPGPTGTAACIACPRIFRRRAASATLSAPAAASAEYSPSEWPATILHLVGEAEALLRLQHAHDGERNRHQRRLRVLGQRQRLERAR